jgi:hypothetical protein
MKAKRHRAVSAWKLWREQWLAQTKRTMGERWERLILVSRLRALEFDLQRQERRMRVLSAQLG